MAFRFRVSGVLEFQGFHSGVWAFRGSVFDLACTYLRGLLPLFRFRKVWGFWGFGFRV